MAEIRHVHERLYQHHAVGLGRLLHLRILDIGLLEPGEEWVVRFLGHAGAEAIDQLEMVGHICGQDRLDHFRAELVVVLRRKHLHPRAVGRLGQLEEHAGVHVLEHRFVVVQCRELRARLHLKGVVGPRVRCVMAHGGQEEREHVLQAEVVAGAALVEGAEGELEDLDRVPPVVVTHSARVAVLVGNNIHPRGQLVLVYAVLRQQLEGRVAEGHQQLHVPLLVSDPAPRVEVEIVQA
mmetsp:Transcript_101584/g.276101  ORF Transcript_101584/g.276101 Transcript_101584/m.276101 type:complete len:237 (-) Transcript_101584:7-717(-)